MTTATIPRRKHRFNLLGDLPDFQQRPLEMMLELANEYPPLTRLRFGPVTQFVVSDPGAARHVLQHNSRNYRKEQQMMDAARLVLQSGDDLFTSDGEPWLQRRRAMQPIYHRGVIAGFGAVMVEEATRLADGWQSGRPVDMEQAMMDATMGVIGRTMLSRDILVDYPQLYHAFATASEFVIQRATTVSGRFTPLSWPTAHNRAFRRAIDTIRTMLGEAVRERKALPSAERPTDLLTLLMAGRDDESGFTLSPDQLMDELYGIVTAGHETSSIALAAFFYELACNEPVMERVMGEIDRVLGGRPPSTDAVADLPYLGHTLDETLRRYPAAYVTTRQAIEADEVLGHAIPSGAMVLVNIYGLHHHNAHWREPMVFDPDRWTRDAVARNAFLPFGAGPRKCIGEPLARLEMQLIAATLLQRFRFRPIPDQPMQIRARFTLRAADGIWLKPIQR